LDVEFRLFEDYSASNLNFRKYHRSGNKNKRKADEFMFGHVAKRDAMRMFVENTELLQGCSTTYKPEYTPPVVEVGLSY
jgi:hypothetical protein